jgi:hypothetical protein
VETPNTPRRGPPAHTHPRDIHPGRRAQSVLSFVRILARTLLIRAIHPLAEATPWTDGLRARIVKRRNEWHS